MTTNPINPDFNSYVRDTDFKGSNKSMPAIESTKEANVFYELDEDGNRVRCFRDNDKDGNIDIISNLDAEGKVTDEIIDENGDGKADIHVTYDYDDQGNEIARHVDLDMDGNIDVIQYVDKTSTIYTDDIDADDNGTIDIHVNYEYDNEGNTNSSIDTNLDGKADVIAKTNSKGETVSEEMDTNKDGKIDSHFEYTYESGERETTVQKNMKPIKGDLPSGWVVSDGKIMNADGQQVGMVVRELTDNGAVETLFEFVE